MDTHLPDTFFETLSCPPTAEQVATIKRHLYAAAASALDENPERAAAADRRILLLQQLLEEEVGPAALDLEADADMAPGRRELLGRLSDVAAALTAQGSPGAHDVRYAVELLGQPRRTLTPLETAQAFVEAAAEVTAQVGPIVAVEASKPHLTIVRDDCEYLSQCKHWPAKTCPMGECERNLPAE